MTFDDAIFRAGMERFRAIFLTSITTMAGLAPIILKRVFKLNFSSLWLFQLLTALDMLLLNTNSFAYFNIDYNIKS